MCFYKENMDSNVAKDELTLAEYDKISRQIPFINVLGISGGEPFLRRDLSEIIRIIYKNCQPLVVDLPTNGYFPQLIVEQAEKIARNCPKMTIDLQLSIDGPPQVHDEIRGLKNSFERMRQTYLGLQDRKGKYKNLKLKACVVFSHYNQDHIAELFDILARDFPDFDRIVFSVVHGSAANHEAFDFDWQKYFAFCEQLRNTARVDRVTDFHSLFTMALRIAKNDFLKKVLQDKNMFRHCRAGKGVVAISETGKVFPCEPLWEAVGDLRQNGYDLKAILRSKEMQAFQRKIREGKCTCHWGLPMSNTIMFSPRYYPKIVYEMGRIARRSLGSRANM
jgi:MoaA/NifB/PqqE/SkfB family radical SAM enzyme